MLTIFTSTDPLLASISPLYRQTVERAVHNLCSPCRPDTQPDDQSFVVFIEAADEPLLISSMIHKDISIALEGAFRDGSCLVGVVLYGNSGSGVTLICPEQEGYAPQLADIFRNHLSGEKL